MTLLLAASLPKPDMRAQFPFPPLLDHAQKLHVSESKHFWLQHFHDSVPGKTSAFSRARKFTFGSWFFRQALSWEITLHEAKFRAGSVGSNVDAVGEALLGKGAMGKVVPQGVGDAADDLLSATLHHRRLGLDHGHASEEEEGLAKLGENHFLAGVEVVKSVPMYSALI